MSKYDPLWKYISDNNKEEYKLSYEEIKNILGFSIDHSFLTYKKELIQYNYCVEKISLKNRNIKFKKVKNKMDNGNDLIINIDKIHTTELGKERIKKNINLENENVVQWCKKLIINEKTNITRKGKNWYARKGNVILTINAYSYTIITAHLKQ